MSNHRAVSRHASPPAVEEGGAGVWIGRLAVTDFRNYARAEIAVDRRPVVLTGPNGAGKTNLLEAISFLVPGRGLRRARLGEVDRLVSATTGATRPAAWGVAATINSSDGAIDIGTGRDPGGVGEKGRERRLVKVNGAFVGGPLALAEYLAVIWLTPQMDRLFLDGAGPRRRFFDRLVSGLDPDHAKRLARYEHALNERSQILRQRGAPGADPAWLDALEQQIAERGVAVAAARREVVGWLSRGLASTAGPFPRGALAVDGAIEAWLDRMPALAVEDEFRARLRECRGRDAETGGAQWGPHRSDVAVRHLATGLPAASCSTGEQKAMLLSILLAHARLQVEGRGRAPLLLLDEVAAHLDGPRRSALYAEILSLGAQAWLTGTDEALFAELGSRIQFLRVRNAVILRA